MPFNIEDLEPEVQDYILTLQTELAESDAALEGVTKTANEQKTELAKLRADAEREGVRKAGDDDTAFEAAIAKADPATQEFMKAQRQQNKALLARIEKAEKDDFDKTMIAKAQALPFVPGTDEEKADLFAKMYSVKVPVNKADGSGTEDKPIGELVETVLKTMNGQLESSLMFQDIGSGGAITAGVALPGQSEAERIAESRATELRKADPTLTREQAIVKVYEADPSLYVQAQEG